MMISEVQDHRGKNLIRKYWNKLEFVKLFMDKENFQIL